MRHVIMFVALMCCAQTSHAAGLQLWQHPDAWLSNSDRFTAGTSTYLWTDSNIVSPTNLPTDLADLYATHPNSAGNSNVTVIYQDVLARANHQLLFSSIFLTNDSTGTERAYVSFGDEMIILGDSSDSFTLSGFPVNGVNYQWRSDWLFFSHVFQDDTPIRLAFWVDGDNSALQASFVRIVPIVPNPAAYAGGLALLGVVGVQRLRRKR